jgi:peroxiredoxin Q/BCP
MTPGCTQQACDFSDSLDSLSAAGFEVLGISPDPPDALGEFRRRDLLAITLLSDPDMTAIRAYGAYGEKTSLAGPVTGLIRSTFVVDENGRLEIAQYDVAPSGHVAALRRELGLTGA